MYPSICRQRDGRQHVVGAPGQLAQHGDEVFPIHRLAEDDVVQDHTRVGRQDGQLLPALADRNCLVLGHANDIVPRAFPSTNRLIDVRRHDLVRYTHLIEQLAPPWGRRGKTDQWSIGGHLTHQSR